MGGGFILFYRMCFWGAACLFLSVYAVNFGFGPFSYNYLFIYSAAEGR